MESQLSMFDTIYLNHTIQLPRITILPLDLNKTWTIKYHTVNTIFGKAVLANTEIGICDFAFTDQVDDFKAALLKKYKKAIFINEKNTLQQQVQKYFENTKGIEDIVLHLSGTPFQFQVWQELLNIPFGSHTTYKSLANALHRPTASRAVGRAIGSNAVAYFVPCHRVIHTAGDISGYKWGVNKKIEILKWESAVIEKYQDDTKK